MMNITHWTMEILMNSQMNMKEGKTSHLNQREHQEINQADQMTRLEPKRLRTKNLEQLKRPIWAEDP